MKTGELNYLDITKAYYDRVGLSANNYDWELVVGRGRFNKIVANAKQGASRHAVAFIDRQTGALYKAASWSQAAKTRIA